MELVFKFVRTCWICGKGVALENCIVDEHGAAVHEACYIACITLNNAGASLAKQSVRL